jgi:hypothetical protein
MSLLLSQRLEGSYHLPIAHDPTFRSSCCQKSEAIASIQSNDISYQRRWLVVGDGDLSYSASIASELSQKGIHLTATVWEDQERHRQVYERSTQNVKAIILASIDNQDHSVLQQDYCHKILFGVDATQLPLTFPTTKFHRIIFNFPHWRGKTNAKRNRQLVNDFFQSATQVLEEKDGEICIALCEGQGGFPSSTSAEWRQSWLVASYAAEHGLLLQKLESYQPQYMQSSHRGIDRPWKKSGNNQLYTFGFPSKNDHNNNNNNNNKNYFVVDESLQLSVRHELRIMLHPEKLLSCPVSRNDIVNGDAVYELARKEVVMPDGIEFQIATRYLLTPDDQDHHKRHHVPLAVFLMNYCGISHPLTRPMADNIRAQLETAVQEQWQLDVAKAGRLVSRPYPRHLLSTLIKQYSR